MTSERPPGLLTEDQREYLRADKSERRDEYSRQKRYRRRKAIRRRVKNGLLDLTLVQQRLEEDEREKVFDELAAEGEGGSRGYNVLVAMTALAFEGTRRRDLSMAPIAKAGAEAAVARDVKENLRVRARADIATEVVDPVEHAPAPASAAEKLDDGAEIAELTTEEQGAVLRYMDERGLTTGEVDGAALLEWWWERDEG